jgi:uncharacterized protein YkwD
MTRAALRPLGHLLSAHPAIARVAVASLSLSFIFVVSQIGTSQASPPQVAAPPKSILPDNVGVGIRSTDPVSISFDAPMDRASVEAALSVRPALDTITIWSADNRTLNVAPSERWSTDARYVVTIGEQAQLADGEQLSAPERFSFTTQTAPRVSAFRLSFPTDIDPQRQRAMPGANRADSRALANVPALDVVGEVSTGTSIVIGFSSVMDRADTARHFLISPSIAGSISWSGNSLVFTPSERLPTDARYAISVAGAHDALGNRLGGDASFSFTTRAGAQVVRRTPDDGATNVETGPISIWFSQPMDAAATAAAWRVTDLTSGAAVKGTVAWNEDLTQLSFTPDAALPKGHKIQVSLADGAQDVDHNPLTSTWAFSTKPAPRPVVRTPVTGPPPPADVAAYALWQINQSRAAYGFAPLQLDAKISAVASAHALDMIQYGYFSHTGRDGSHVSDRLRRGGVSFSWSGENICYYNGLPVKSMLNWCHSVFMSEPYPGVANHIGNILSPHYTRVGLGVASSGTRIIIVWDFAG